MDSGTERNAMDDRELFEGVGVNDERKEGGNWTREAGAR